MTDQSPAPMTPGAAMTLAAIAATAADPRPSGETLAAQEQRITYGVKQQLADTRLTTLGVWQLRWLALSPDNANMAYLAQNTSGANQFAVVVRGTNANAVDMMEDLDVGTVVPFNIGSTTAPPTSVSKGAMAAFTQLMRMSNTLGPTIGTLEQAVASALVGSGAPPGATVFVIGHSLGGCLATMLAVYLRSRPGGTTAPKFGVLTFAAPTAGLADFAKQFNDVDWAVNDGYVNAYDMVPLAWESLSTAASWYPPPGPKANFEVTEGLIPTLEGLTGPNAYVQPSNVVQLNPGNYKPYDPAAINPSVGDFLAQVAAQHANSTYLDLLKAPQLTSAPVVTSLSATVGQEGNEIIVNGFGFTKDCVVDFGTSPCTRCHALSDTQMSAFVPAGLGVVSVRVTNNLGTSPAVPTAQFAYGGPAPVTVTGINPTSGALRTKVTIKGVGFAANPTVYFGKNTATNVSYDPKTQQITADAPASGSPKSVVRDVRVLVNGYLSPAGPADEFTYPN